MKTPGEIKAGTNVSLPHKRNGAAVPSVLPDCYYIFMRVFDNLQSLANILNPAIQYIMHTGQQLDKFDGCLCLYYHQHCTGTEA